MRMTSSPVLSLICLVSAVVPRPATAGESASSLRLRPESVSLGMSYHGVVVHAEGTAPVGYTLALVCTGERGELALKKKEKILGLLWLNRGEVHFADVPSLYLLVTSEALRKLAPQDLLDSVGVGYPALETAAVGEPQADRQTHRLFAELLKLKQREGLFAVNEHGLQLHRQAGQAHWSADLRFPSKLLPGDYGVRLLGFRGGAGRLIDQRTLKARQAGAVAAIHSFAEKRGLWYGIGAVLMALAVGLLTGLVFGLGSKRGH